MRSLACIQSHTLARFETIALTNLVAVLLMLLMMCSCSSAKVMRKLYEVGIQVAFAPPNTTPILQPLDNGPNQQFKVHYRMLYAEWFMKEGIAHKTKAGNFRKPPNEKVLSWIVSSFLSCSIDSMMRSWHHTLDDPQGVARSIAFVLQHRAEGNEDVIPIWIRNAHQQEIMSNSGNAVWNGGDETSDVDEVGDDDVPDDEEREKEAALNAHNFDHCRSRGSQ
jgi:DDE superfamily endonuclease